MEVTKELKSLDDLVTLEWEDIVITGHSVNRDPFKTNKPEMAI
jgi:ribosomal protein S19E (S16A)